MPELPEVEVTRQGLMPHLPGRLILAVTWSNKRLRTPMPRKLLLDMIKGNRVFAIDRRGKFLLFRMSNDSILVIHLGMTGKITLIPANEPLVKHDHFRLLLDDGTELRFNDSRRFGCIAVWPPNKAHSLEKQLSGSLGPEPFGKECTGAYLHHAGSRRKQPVKNFLMDSRVVAGIGNIYANEILYDVKIHPQTPVACITIREWQKIVASCRKIMKKAIQAGGSTISDFLGTGGNPGYFQVQFKVYGRNGQPCKKCRNLIQKKVIGGRATYYCPECQPNGTPNGNKPC